MPHQNGSIQRLALLALVTAALAAGAMPAQAAPDADASSTDAGVAAERPRQPRAADYSACEGAEIDARYCNRCHSQTAQLDAVIGDLWRVEDLLIDPQRFAESTHSRLDCLDCHALTWPFFPHPEEPFASDLTCLACHHDRRIQGRFDFEEINAQFERSIHYQKLAGAFTCDSCHDPHVFKATDEHSDIREVVERSNAACTSCHLSRQTFGLLSDRKFPLLEASHEWLPAPALHWRYVRCVECHTPDERRFSHQVEATAHSGRFCEKCHSRDSVLLTKLYRHRVSENKERYGFTNSIVFNDAYIIGMTRNAVLDRLFLILALVVVVGVGGHAALRALAARRRRRDG